MRSAAQPTMDDAQARKAQQLAEYRAYAASRPNTSMTDEQKVEDMKARSMTARRDMYAKKAYDPEAVNEMIASKDQAAMHSTGSTSGTRSAQVVGRGAKATQDVASSVGGEFFDKVTGLPIASTVDALALGTEATTMKTAMKDPRRQEAARTTQSAAAEAHERGHDAVTALRQDLDDFHHSGGITPSDATARLTSGSGLTAFRAAGETIRAHNEARRAAIAAGGVNDLIKPMSMDHTLGDEVATIGGKAVVDDGAKIDSSYTAAVRQKKEARKGEIKQSKQDLRDRQAARQRGEADPEFDTHMQALGTEKAQHTAELDTLKQAQKSRDRLGRMGLGYKLTEQEQRDQKTSNAEADRLDKQITSAHGEHVKGLTERLAALEKTGSQQKEADRKRGSTSIFSPRQRFSKKDQMAALETERDAIRARQSEKIQSKLDGATAALATTTDPRRKQMIQDQIAMHSDHLAKSKSDPTFVSRQHLGADDRAMLQDKLSQLSTLQREKDTGLTADQQKEHDRIRASIDAAKQGGTAGARAEDLAARQEHQAKLANFENLSKHGLTLDQSARKATIKKRLASIGKTEKTKLTEQERADFAGLVDERQKLKGMNKKAAKFERTHRDETVSMGRVGGVGTDHNEARDVTSTSDGIASSVNSLAAGLHGAGEVVEADLDKGREALQRGDATKAQLISGSKVGQNVAGIVGDALGVKGVDSVIEKVGQGMQGTANVLGGATHEAANRALFAKNARSMIPDDEGKTGRFREVNAGVMDFHGQDAEAFGKGGVKAGVQQLAGVLHEPLTDAFGDQLSDAVQPVTDAVHEHVVQPLSHGVGSASDAVHEHVVQPLTDAVGSASDAVRPVADAVHEHVVQPVSDAVHENVVQPVSDAVRPVADAVRPAADALHEHVIQPSADAAHEMAEEKAGEAAQEKAKDLWDQRNAPEERTDPQDNPSPVAPALAPGPAPAPGPTPAPAPSPGPNPGPTPPAPAPGPPAKKLSWWQRAIRAVKSGVRSVGRGMRRGWSRLKGFFSRSSR